MILHFFFLVCTCSCLGQSKSSTNTWFLLQSRFEIRKQLHTVEIGHRRQEAFFERHRQSLLRYTFSYQVNAKKTGFGGGIACFFHERKNARTLETEVRPFIQVSQRFMLRDCQFQLRFRHEFRIFDQSTADQNRMRLQLQYTRLLHPKLKLLCSSEWFYSHKSLKPWEWRGGVSLQQHLFSNWKVGLGYIYQNNESSAIRSIHVIQVACLYEFLLN